MGGLEAVQVKPVEPAVGPARASAVHVVAVVPAWNEAPSVGGVVRAIVGQGIECLVVDDASTDGTAEAASQAGAEVVRQRRHWGLGPAIRRGYEEALGRGADIVVQIDADGQYDPGDIPGLLQPILDGEADMVLGCRLDDVRYEMPWLKRLGNRAFSWVLRRLTKQDIRDGQTGFRAMHRELLAKALPINEFTYTQEMIIRAAKEGFRIQSVPVPFYERRDGKSRLFTSPLDFAFRGWWIIVRTWRDYHPFKFFFWPGALLVVASVVPAVIAAQHWLSTGFITGRLGTLITAGVLFLFGVQLMFLGLLADMIRTHTRY